MSYIASPIPPGSGTRPSWNARGRWGYSAVAELDETIRAAGGVDSAFSLEPAELRALVAETERAWQALGDIRYGPTAAERASLRFRRSIYIAADVKAGDVLTRENLRIVRPGFGLAPKHYDSLLGRRANRDLAMGTAMDWGYVGMEIPTLDPRLRT